jgi:ribosomal protein S15P/S13E
LGSDGSVVIEQAFLFFIYLFYFGSISQSGRSRNDLQELEDRAETIRDHLATALKLCVEKGNCLELQEQILKMVRFYEGRRYEMVTLEELQSIKAAMASGRGEIVTHLALV